MADTADIVTVDDDRREREALNTPEMNFDARTTTQDGNKFGGSMKIAALNGSADQCLAGFE